MQSSNIENIIQLLENPIVPELQKYFNDGHFIAGEHYKLVISIPKPPINSSITPVYMEAFLDIQRQIYQLAALKKTGIANTNFLSEDEKRNLDAAIVVSEGSSIFEVNFGDVIDKIANEVIGKMSGTEITVSLITIAAMLTSGWAFKVYMGNKKSIKMDEIKSADHRQALETITEITKQDKEKFDKVTELLIQNGEFGKKSLEVIEKGYDAFIKAASKTDESVINDVHLDQREAKALRAPSRPRSEQDILIKKVRVTDISTRDPLMIFMDLEEYETGEQYKLKFSDRLIDAKYRADIFRALETREPIIAELIAKTVDGDIRSVELKKVIVE